jgi:hypothetical protein
MHEQNDDHFANLYIFMTSSTTDLFNTICVHNEHWRVAYFETYMVLYRQMIILYLPIWIHKHKLIVKPPFKYIFLIVILYFPSPSIV